MVKTDNLLLHFKRNEDVLTESSLEGVGVGCGLRGFEGLYIAPQEFWWSEKRAGREKCTPTSCITSSLRLK